MIEHNDTPAKSTLPSAAAVQVWIVDEVARALDLPADRIDVNERFRTYGLDSAFGTALVTRLARWLGRPFRATMLWEHPTIATLAAHVASAPADGAKAQPAAPRERAQVAMTEPIAVIGIGCRFPGGASSPEAYWSLLRDGRDAITDVPADRWDVAAFHDDDASVPGKMTTRRGGFVDAVDRFDAEFFGISPREAAQMDPQQRLMLEVAWAAIEDAGVVPASLKGTAAGVFVGAMWSDYGRLDRCDERGIEQHTATGLDTSIIPARISYSLGLQGPSIAVNTACSSSLVAVHLACQSLRTGESTLALAGGVSLVLSPWSTVAMTKFGAMSPAGQCRAFDAGADGYARGEGAGLVVLKPLSQALRDGDRVYCVLVGSAVNNDGFSNGLTAPNPMAQEEVLRKAYANAGVDPLAVQYVETHGPGTLLGDPIEAHALGSVLGAGRSPDRALHIGSVKTNLGHTEAAAGIAGLIKVALSMKQGLLPASLHFERPNPHVPFEALGLQVQARAGRWPESDDGMIAGVSSFGFGGTNCHVVVRGAPRSAPRIYPLGAERPAVLREWMLELLSIATQPRTNDDLDELSRFVAHERSAGPHRAALVADGSADLVRQLLASLSEARTDRGVVSPPRIVWVCPGQGSQWLGMGRSLLRTEPEFHAALQACDRAIAKVTGWSLLGELLASPEASRLDEVDVVQPVLFAIQIALGALWRSWGVVPDVIVGHSMGEIAAAHLAGLLTLDEAARVACVRSRVLRKSASSKGAMLAVALPADAAIHAAGSPEGVVVAAHNGPSSTVLSGDASAIEAALEKLTAAGHKASKVNVDYASHHPGMDALREEILAELSSRTGSSRAAAVGAVRMVSSVSLRDLRAGDCGPTYWTENLRQPVRFMQALRTVFDEGDAVVLEISAHPVLVRAIEGIGTAPGRSVKVLASLDREKDDRGALLATLAQLHALGAPISWGNVCPGAPAKRDWMPARAGTQSEAEQPRVELVAISAKSEDALRAHAARIANHLAANPALRVVDVAFTAATTRSHFAHRVTVVASTPAQARERLGAIAARSDGAATPGTVARGAPPKIAFLFSGQGSQYAGMGRDLYATEPAFRDAIDACAERADASLDRPLKSVMFDAPDADGRAPLDETLYTQLALLSFEYALFETWRSWGVRPDVLIGHSIGEIAAACAAGVMSLDDAVLLVSARARLMQALPPGGVMTAVGAPEADVRKALEGFGSAVSIAAVNGATQTVLSGPSELVRRVASQFEARGAEVQGLRVSHAFHSDLMTPMLDELREAAGRVRYRAAEIPIVSNLSGDIAGVEHTVAEYWVRHAREPVQFQRGVRRLERLGVTSYVEIGPQPVLLGMLGDCLDDAASVEKLPSSRRGRSEREVALRSLGRLWTLGCEVDWRVLCATGRRVDLPTYPFARKRHWLAPRASAESVAAPLPATSPSTRTFVIDGQHDDSLVADALWKLHAESDARDALVVRTTQGAEVTVRLRRFIDALAVRRASLGGSLAWQASPVQAPSVVEPAIPAKVEGPAAPKPVVEAAERTSTRAAFVGLLEALPAGARRAEMVKALQGDAAMILGVERPDDVVSHRPLRELGFDSLMSMELRKKIAARLGRKIAASVAFDYPTIDALAAYLMSKVLGLDEAVATPTVTRAPVRNPASVDQTLDALHAELRDVATLLGAR